MEDGVVGLELFVAAVGPDFFEGGLGDVEEGVVAELGGIDVEDDGVRIHLDGGELVEAEGEIEIGLGVVGGPAAATAEGVAEACEGEDVFGEVCGQVPHGGVLAVVTPAFELACVIGELDFPAPVGGAAIFGDALGMGLPQGEKREAWQEPFPESHGWVLPDEGEVWREDFIVSSV